MSEPRRYDGETQHSKDEDEEKRAVSCPIIGDLLEMVLSYVPLVDLVAACSASESWNYAVSWSLCCINQTKPWLIVHARSRRPPFGTTVQAYDPRSDLWFDIISRKPSRAPTGPLRSGHSSLLYALSPSQFSFSVDPLHLTWHHVEPPRVWRTDPVVAAVGKMLMVAGGVCDFEDDVLAVEILDIETGVWTISQSMPTIFKGSATATLLTVAATAEEICIADKQCGTACSFDPYTESWTEPFVLCPEDEYDIHTRAISSLGGRMIIVGVVGKEETEGVKVWEVTGDWRENFKLIGVMPKACVEKLRGSGYFSSLPTSISANAMGSMVYIHNDADPREIVVAEIVEGWLSRWTCVANVASSERRMLAEKFLLTCSDVKLSDLKRASREGDCLCPIVRET